jgi:hypothetical protein
MEVVYHGFGSGHLDGMHQGVLPLLHPLLMLSHANHLTPLLLRACRTWSVVNSFKTQGPSPGPAAVVAPTTPIPVASSSPLALNGILFCFYHYHHCAAL